MTSAYRIHTRILKFFLAVLLVLPGATIVQGQTKQLLTWQKNLDYLQNIPDSNLKEQEYSVEQIRTGLGFWLQLHPKSDVQLPDAHPQPWSVEQIKTEISTLQETVGTLLKQESFQPFELGVTEITVTSELSPLSPVADSIDSTNIEKRHAISVTRAFEFLPGISIDYKTSRNQSGIWIRGFDTRQVGFYLDNIPIYVPYDGYADMGRFLTSEVAEIQVAKGYSSPLLGPNGLGGAVNIVTKQPEKKFEGQLNLGTGSGEMLESGIHIGSRWGKFMFQGGMDWLQTDSYPVSGNFDSTYDVNGNQPNYDRTNSSERDIDYDGRIGFLPNDRDRYIFSFMGQKAENAAPPYSGWDDDVKPKYWRWPYWDRESYYFNGQKGLGKDSEIQFRAFYDQYPNRLDIFNSSFSTLQEYSTYNDHSAGFSSEFSTRMLDRHTIGASFFFKDDTHKEADVEFDDGESVEIPGRTHRDQQMSIGIQDAINLTSRIRATLGFSMEHIDGIKAQDLYSRRGEYSIIPFECADVDEDEPFAACLDEWAFNPLASVSFSITKSGTFFATFAKKSHFPTMKDRYSYKNNAALPNPSLESEHSRNWSIGYSHVFPFKTMFQVDLFRSDVYDAIERALISVEDEDVCSRIDGPFCEQSVNVGKVLNQGVEFIVRSSPSSRLTLDMHYSYLSRSIPGPDNIILTDTPKHKTVGTINILLPRDISLLATARYESGTIGDFSIEENDPSTPYDDEVILYPGSNFATVDLGGIVPICDGLKLQLGVNNLFDRNYWYREGYPRPGRNWYFNMKYRF